MEIKTPTDAQIRRELALVAKTRQRHGLAVEPWWERRIHYLSAAGRRELIEREGLYGIRARARLVARRRSL